MFLKKSLLSRCIVQPLYITKGVWGLSGVQLSGKAVETEKEDIGLSKPTTAMYH